MAVDSKLFKALVPSMGRRGALVLSDSTSEYALGTAIPGLPGVQDDVSDLQDDVTALQSDVADLQAAAAPETDYTGAASTRAAVRAEVGDTPTVGSVYRSTAGKLYLKTANAAADTDWQRATTTAAD